MASWIMKPPATEICQKRNSDFQHSQVFEGAACKCEEYLEIFALCEAMCEASIDTHSISAASFEKRFGREAIAPVFSSRLTLGDAHTQVYLLHAFAILAILAGQRWQFTQLLNILWRPERNIFRQHLENHENSPTMIPVHDDYPHQNDQKGLFFIISTTRQMAMENMIGWTYYCSKKSAILGRVDLQHE